MVLEMKLDSSFTNASFTNFSLKDIPLHLDIIEITMVGEIVLFIREDMPAKTLVKHTIYKRF